MSASDNDQMKNGAPSAQAGSARTRSLASVLFGVVFAGLIFVIGWTVLAACGVRTPLGDISFAWCRAEAAIPPVALDRERSDVLREQIARLERTLRHPDRCGPRVARIPDPPKDEVKPPSEKPEPEKSLCETDEGKAQPVDVYFLLDLTGSFKDDLNNMSRLMADLVKRIQSGEFGKDVRLGLGSFMDKPQAPFGRHKMYTFKNHQSLTLDVARLVPAVKSLRVAPGGDVPEAQFEALVEMVGKAKTIGFRKGVRSFVALVTDAPPHVAGHWRKPPKGRRIPKRFARLYSPGPEDGKGDSKPLNEDYPSQAQVADALDSLEISPIFLVSGASIRIYQGFVSKLGRGVTFPISADSSNLLQALFAGLEKACRDNPATAKDGGKK